MNNVPVISNLTNSKGPFNLFLELLKGKSGRDIIYLPYRGEMT